MRFILVFCMIWVFSGCTMDMPDANVPSNPPKLEKNLFDEFTIRGQYQQDGAPTMFLWPTDTMDEESGDLTPLSFKEKAEARGQITLHSETVSFYFNQIKTLLMPLNNKYGRAILALETKFTANKCYTFCDPEVDWLCDPEDEAILNVEAWVQSDDPAIKAEILVCEQNQDKRQELKKQWDKGKEANKDIVRPLQVKAGVAAEALKQAIGARNYFSDVTKFSFNYDLTSFDLKLQYGGFEYSNLVGAERSIKNINFDNINGFLSFTVDAIDFKKDNQIYGKIIFDLEFTQTEWDLSIGGDIRLQYLDGRTERVGRFASSGQVVTL